MGAEPGKIQAVVALIGRFAHHGYHGDALMREERAATIHPEPARERRKVSPRLVTLMYWEKNVKRRK